MPSLQSRRTTRALAMIGKRRKDGQAHTAYSAARLCGISLSTIYRAISRRKDQLYGQLGFRPQGPGK